MLSDERADGTGWGLLLSKTPGLGTVVMSARAGVQVPQLRRLPKCRLPEPSQLPTHRCLWAERWQDPLSRVRVMSPAGGRLVCAQGDCLGWGPGSATAGRVMLDKFVTWVSDFHLRNNFFSPH